MNPSDISIEDGATPHIFKDLQDAQAEITVWIDTSEDPLVLAPLIDELTFWEVKGPYRSDVLSFLHNTRASLISRYNKGAVLLTQKADGVAMINIPGSTISEESTVVCLDGTVGRRSTGKRRSAPACGQIIPLRWPSV